MLRLTAFLLPVDDVEVDFGWVANGPISIWRNLNEQHALDRDCDTYGKKKRLPSCSRRGVGWPVSKKFGHRFFKIFFFLF